jgi:RND superfamily putative drug exporter
MGRLGAFAYHRREAILVAACVWFAVALILLARGGRLSTGAIHGLEAERAAHLAETVVGRSTETTLVVIFTSATAEPADPEFVSAMDRALAPLANDPRVRSVTTPANAGALMAARMIDAPSNAAFALVSFAGDLAEAAASYRALRSTLRSDTLTITCTGHVAFMRDLDRILEHDLVRAEAVSLPICVLLLCAVFGSLVAASLPVCVGALAVVSGIAAVTVLSRFMELAQYTINVCSLIGLGVAIDYCLFIVSRYREELAAGQSYEGALERSLETAGRVVLFSGFAVTSGLAGLFFFPGSYLLAMGLGGAIVVGFAVLAALTVLPALLAALGPRIHYGRLRRLPRLASPIGDRFWHRTAERVMRHPVRVLVPALAVLLVLGAPFLRLRMMASDVRVLPAEAEARAGYELLRHDFPDEGANHIPVAVEFPTAPALDARRVEALYDLVVRATRVPFVTGVEGIIDPTLPVPREAWPGVVLSPPPEIATTMEGAKHLSVGGKTVLFDVVTDEAPESPRARAIVRALRADRAVADGTLFVGGQTANDVDTTTYVLERAPRVVGFVVIVTYVVLFLLLGSVVLPVKAVLMNFLSIAGSFGALVWIFQEGHLFVDAPRPLEPSLPVLLFCALFGLSMDYEVLMLTRMKEAFERTGDPVGCVAEGLEKSAGLITSAAAIMIAVFSAFAFAHIVLIQAVGLGMALAVALDATLVRVLVVPATMRLLGHLNWWAPRSLAKLARNVGLGEGH